MTAAANSGIWSIGIGHVVGANRQTSSGRELSELLYMAPPVDICVDFCVMLQKDIFPKKQNDV